MLITLILLLAAVVGLYLAIREARATGWRGPFAFFTADLRDLDDLSFDVRHAQARQTATTQAVRRTLELSARGEIRPDNALALIGAGHKEAA